MLELFPYIGSFDPSSLGSKPGLSSVDTQASLHRTLSSHGPSMTNGPLVTQTTHCELPQTE